MMKSDKNELIQKSKVQEKELSELSEEIAKLKQTNVSKAKELKQIAKIIKSKESDLEIVNQENCKLKASREVAFTTQQNLLNEKKKNETNDPKFSCRICEEMFDTKVKLSEHVAEEHQHK